MGYCTSLICSLQTQSLTILTHGVQNILWSIWGDFYFFSYYIQHCFICRPSDSTVPTDAGIEPKTVETGALAVRRSKHQARSHPHQARSHPRCGLYTLRFFNPCSGVSHTRCALFCTLPSILHVRLVPSVRRRDLFKQGVTRRCRLSWLTNSALVYRVQMRGDSGVSANEYSCAHHVTWSQNKLWISNSIFNLCFSVSLI